MQMLARKKLLGDYHVGKTIGQGAFSKVKIGYHRETGQKVAIKIIDKKQIEAKAKKAKQAQEEREKRKRAEELKRRPRTAEAQAQEEERKQKEKEKEKQEEKEKQNSDKAAGEKSFVSSLQPEVQLLMRLDHPNVITLYQVMETEDECFVIMEYASGGELIDYIAARSRLTEKEARKFFRQIISAMDHCHQANVVHRDLKLENLLLNSDRNILISDFGLGRTFTSDQDDYMKTFCGTPNYAAVELISGIPYIGVKSDVWAMGVVLYVMMTGRPPFVGENISALYSKIKAVDYKCPDYFSPELRKLLSRILVRDPKARIDMEGLRNDPWVNFEEPGPPSRISPRVTSNSDASAVGQYISSITKEKTFTIYTFRSHVRDSDTPVTAKYLQKKRSSISNHEVLVVRTAAASAADPSNKPIVEEEDKVSPLPSAPPITKPKTHARRMSMQERSTPPLVPSIPNVGSGSSNPLDLNPGSLVQVPMGGYRRRAASLRIQVPGIITTISSHVSPVDKRSTDSMASPASVNTGHLRASTADSSKVRRASEGLVDLDRDMTKMRRMSMVSPITSDSTTVRESMSDSPNISGKLASAGPMTNSSIDNSVIDSSVATDETVEPSKKEIEDWHLFHRPPKEIRSVRFAFNSATTSSMAPALMFQEVHRVLVVMQSRHSNQLQFSRVEDYYMLECSYTLSSDSPDAADGEFVKFEIEICKVWLLKVHGVRLKRLSGSALIFKELHSEFVGMLEL